MYSLSSSYAERSKELAAQVIRADLVDLCEAGPALAGVLTPRAALGAVRIGTTEQFLEQAGTYHGRYAAVPYFRNLIEQATRGRLGAEPSVILDIGSGSGNSVLPCLELFAHSKIVATDLSESLLAVLRDHISNPALRERLALVCIDTTMCDVVEESVDLVIGAAVLHRLIDPSKGVRQALRALKPGGTAVFFEPFEDGNAILRLAYEQILARDNNGTGEKLSAEVSRCLRMLIDDFRVRAGTDKSAPIYQRIESKWLFTRSYFESLAKELGVQLEIEPLNQSNNLFTSQTLTHVRLALGLTFDGAKESMPAWALNVLNEFDTAFSSELMQGLPIEARVVFQRPGTKASTRIEPVDDTPSFNSLWIDKEEAPAVLDRMEANLSTAELGKRLRFFSQQGYCIIPDAIPASVVDKYLTEFQRSRDEGRFKASYGLDVFSAAERDLRKPLTKVLDTHVYCDAALEMAFAPLVKEFLEALFEDKALAFQSLHFEVGSTQAIHQDTAYVVVERPKSLAAIWIALEDIEPGTGELVYYPGSHRFGDFIYPGHRKHWSHDDGNAIHDHHLFWLHDEAKRRQVAQQSFLPKKGTVLIWHADLAHGGGIIRRPEATRRSLVVHYCPVTLDPHYFGSVAPEKRVKHRNTYGGYHSTMYY